VTKQGSRETADEKAVALKEGKLEDSEAEPTDIVIEEQTASADSSLIDDEVDETADEPLDPDEMLARQVSDAKIQTYWDEKERVMGATRLHQEGLSLHEKLLRQWDTNNRYGVSSSLRSNHLICIIFSIC
jgi:DNA polymerase delta subunit 4